MQDWRERFKTDLPFLIVQLPNYGMPPVKPADSRWAELRESQRASVAADKNAALVVTTDLGEDYDVHPPNKQEVGRRLALAARHLVYGEKVMARGPLALSAERSGNRIVIRFDDVERGLVAYGSDALIGFELCDPKACRYAIATISGDRVALNLRGK